MAYIYKRTYPSGKKVYIIGFRDQYGRWRERSAGSRRKDAENLLRRVQEEVSAGTYGVAREDPTFAEFAQTFLAAKKGEVKPSTLTDYREVIKNHLDPFFGRMRLSEISPTKVQGFLVGMQEKEVSPATVGKVYRVLKVILRHALVLGFIDRDPTIGIRQPRVEKREMDHLNVGEVEALLEAADGDLRDIIAVAVFSGLRQGEIFALRWQDIDFEAGIIRVVRSYRRPQGFTDLKSSSSRRTVPMMPRLAEMLKRRFEVCGRPSPDALVFPSAAGTPLDRPNLVTRGFEPSLERAGLRRIRFHDLRHTYASLCIAAGMDPKALQQAMGHSSITVTMDTYAHLFPGSYDRAVARLEAMFTKGEKVIHIRRRRGGKESP